MHNRTAATRDTEQTSSLRAIVSTLLMALSLGILLPAVGSAQTANDVAARIGHDVHTAHKPSGKRVKWSEAVVVIDAPAEQVMSVVTDYARYKELLSSFTESRVLSQRGNKALVYVQASVARGLGTLWAQLNIRPRRPEGNTQVIEASLVEGNVDIMSARWEITPLDHGRTLVMFRILVDPKFPVPTGLLEHENLKIARRTVAGVRKRVAAEIASR